MMTVPLIEPAALAEAKDTLKNKFPIMVQYFLEDTEAYLIAIREGVNENSMGKIISSAHTVKSFSGQMGALRLSEIAKTIEHLAREQVDAGGDIRLFEPLLADLEEATTETKSVFQSMNRREL